MQVVAFEGIMQNFVRFPSKVNSAFGRVFARRKEISDAVTFSWKRTGVEYSVEWLYWYKLASRCLSSHRNLFVEAAAQFDDAEIGSLDISNFEGLLLACG